MITKSPFFILALAMGLTASLASAEDATAQVPPREPNDPQANVKESRDYANLLKTSAWYRAQRIQLECGEIVSPEIKQQCVDSFGPVETSAPRPVIAPGATPAAAKAR
jgi:hypothetical protein